MNSIKSHIKIIASGLLIVFIWIITAPFIMMASPFIFWHKICKGDTVKDILNKGKYGYEGKIIVCTNINNIIFEGEVDIFEKIPEALENMHVYEFEAQDNKLWFQVYRNDKLIKKMKEQLRSYEK